ncbi:MAG: hypothetical protein ILP13_07830 [Lachnospiraceae bacterium]|nr:hypothetical protein [Lachnospiraceae bacterium]
MFDFSKKKSPAAYIFCVLTALQILFGVLWAVSNAGVYRPVFLSGDYLAAARTFVVDEYMGFLYALLAGLPLILLEVLQIAAVVAAGIFFCRTFGVSYVFAGYIVSCPFVLNACFEISPGILLLSLLLVTLCFIRKCGSGKLRYPILVGVMLLTAGLLEPFALVYGALGLITTALVFLFKKKKGSVTLLCCVLAALAVGLISEKAICRPGAYGRVEASFEYLVFQRVTWPKTDDFGFFLPDDLEQELMEKNKESNLVPERMLKGLGPVWNSFLGESAGKREYLSYSLTVLKSGTKERILSLAAHFAMILFMPVSFFYVLAFGARDTVVPRFLIDLSGRAPVISELYLALFLAGFLSRVVYGLIQRWADRKAGKQDAIRARDGLWVLLFVSIYGFFFHMPYFNPGDAFAPALIWAFVFSLPFISEKKD